MRKVILTVLLLLMVIALPVSVHADADNEAPVLQNYSVDKQNVDAGETITFTLDYVEEGTGVKSIYLQYYCVEQSSLMEVYIDPDESSQHTGVYEYSYVVPSDLPRGNYELRLITIVDELSNQSEYSPEPETVWESMLIYVNSDITIEPYKNHLTVSSLELLDKQADPGARVKVRMQVEANGKPLTSMDLVYGAGFYIKSARSYQEMVILENMKLDGNGCITGEGVLPTQLEGGDAIITGVIIDGNPADTRGSYYCSDYTNEYAIYEDDGGKYLQSTGGVEKCYFIGAPYIRIVLKPGVDYEAPVLKSVKVLEDTVTKPGVVKVAIEAEDNVEISSISVDIRQDSGEVNTERYSAEGSKGIDSANFNGIIEVPVSMKHMTGTYRVFMVSLHDTSNNVVQYLLLNENHDENGWFYSANGGRKSYVDTYPEVEVVEEFDIEFETSLTNPQLCNKLSAMEEGKTARIYINSDGVAKAALFEAIRGKDKTIVFYYDNYQWVFNGKDITDPKDVALKINLSPVDGADYGSSVPLLKVVFPENGELPGLANVRIKSDYTYALYQLTKSLLVYHERPDHTLDLEEQSDARYILDDTNHWCYFNLTHNSSFYISGKDIRYNPKKTKLGVGDTFKVSSGLIYKVTKKNTVTFMGIAKKSKTITIPSKVTYKGVSYKVTKIASKALYKNKNVRTLNIGANVTSIGSKAFYGCSKLKTLKISSKKLKSAKVGKYAFKTKGKKVKLKLPSKVKKSYKKWLKKKGLKF